MIQLQGTDGSDIEHAECVRGAACWPRWGISVRFVVSFLMGLSKSWYSDGTLKVSKHTLVSSRTRATTEYVLITLFTRSTMWWDVSFLEDVHISP